MLEFDPYKFERHMQVDTIFMTDYLTYLIVGSIFSEKNVLKIDKACLVKAMLGLNMNLLF